MFEQLFTLNMLKDLAGLVMAVIIVVAFLKLMFKFKGRAAKLSAWGAALVLLFLVYADQGRFDLAAGALVVATAVVIWLLNSMIITFLAMKSYEDVIEPFQKKISSNVFKEGTN
ncbi:MAG: hypothetical protein FH756_01470 [Firmicutes bacterium]|nr:hypothetical protein [Bacillota bacterium]